MPYPDNLLVRGERIIMNKRPHWKVLILPAVFFVLIIGGGFALAAALRNWEYSSTANWVIAVIGVIALMMLVVAPFVRWRVEHFVMTNHHVFFRTGLFARREHQIPLSQIANIETEVSFWGRLMGYGSLIVESSADQPLKFTNVASIGKVQATLNQLIRDERDPHSKSAEDVEYDVGASGNRRTTSAAPADQPPAAQQFAEPAPYPTQQYPPQSHPQQQYPDQGYQQHPQQGYQQPTQHYPPQGYPQQYQQPGYQPQQPTYQNYQPQYAPPPSSTQPTTAAPAAPPAPGAPSVPSVPPAADEDRPPARS